MLFSSSLSISVHNNALNLKQRYLNNPPTFVLSFFLSPTSFYLTMVRSRGVIAFDHTQGHTTVCRTPLDEGSARRRDLYLTTQHSQQTNIHAPGGIRTLNPSRRSTSDPRLRPLGHWNRPPTFLPEFIKIICV